MRIRTTLIYVAAAISVIASAALAACGGGDSLGDLSAGGSDEAQIRNTIDREVAAIRTEDWRTLYGFASPQSREGCSLEEFVSNSAAITPAEGRSWAKIGVRIVSVTVHGDSADVNGVATYDGEDIGTPSTDTWRKIGGVWFVDATGDDCSI